VNAVVAESAKLRCALEKRRRGLDAVANRLRSVCDTLLEDVNGRIESVWADVERELSLARAELEEAGSVQKRLEETVVEQRDKVTFYEDSFVPLLVTNYKLVQADLDASMAEAARRRVLVLPDRGPE